MCLKNSAYDSRNVQYNFVKNSTKSNLFNFTSYGSLDLSIMLLFVWFTTHISWMFRNTFFGCTVVYCFFLMNERQFSSLFMGKWWTSIVFFFLSRRSSHYSVAMSVYKKKHLAENEVMFDFLFVTNIPTWKANISVIFRYW